MRIKALWILAGMLSLGAFAQAQCSTSWTCNIVVTPVDANSVTITWNTAASSTGRVRYGLTTSYGSMTPLVTTPSLTHSATLTGLITGSLYYFQTIDKDSQNNTVNSVQGTFTPQTASNPTVNLNWVASTSTVLGYNIYRSPDQVVWMKINSGLISGTTYTDSGVVHGQTYYYETTAVDDKAESVPSNVAQAVVN